jgi:23S rRNA pseudouridine1911/1915/1917 synthase
MTKRGMVDAPIGRHPSRRTTMAIVATGKPARTHFEVSSASARRRCCAPPETGRTHQIRAWRRSAIRWSATPYGRKGPIAFPRQALHAARLSLIT